MVQFAERTRSGDDFDLFENEQFLDRFEDIFEVLPEYDSIIHFSLRRIESSIISQ